jgi:type IV secretion system protein VirB1
MMPSFDLLQQCAPNVTPTTIAAIIQVESGGNAFALGVNGPVKRLPRPTNVQQAARQARYYMSLGYSVDLGLMQINSNNLRGLGYTVEQILEPCHNLKAGSRILASGYAGATKRYRPGQDALKAALSAYNTGNYEQGFQNGYVAKYYRGNGVHVIVKASPVRSIARTILVQTKPKPTLPVDPLRDISENPYTADTTVYRAGSMPKSLEAASYSTSNHPNPAF